MSFNKITSFNVGFDDIEVLDNSIIKSAGLEKTAGMKLPDGFAYDPDYLYLKVKAVSAGEYWGDNKNNDYFPEEELKKYYKTFLSAHTFKNHENKKIENAIGDVLTAEWNDKMKSVYLLIRIDRRIAPSIVRGYEKGFMTDVSMGCRVSYVVCSYCGKKATSRFDYCDHLKTMKGRIMDNGKKVCEINMGPKFHDISTVLNGAERSAKVEGIYVENGKVAFPCNNDMEKTASDRTMSKSLSSIFENENNERNVIDEKIASELATNSIKGVEKKEPNEKDVENAKDNITANVVANACCDVVKDNLNSLEDIIKTLKLKYTDNWDKNKCTEIGNKLKDIAKKNRVEPSRVFSQFLKVTNSCGIELSPLEIHDIFYAVTDLDSSNLRGLKANPEIKDIIGDGEIARNSLSVSGNLDSVIRNAMDVAETFVPSPYSLGDKPKTRIQIIIAKKQPIPEMNDDFLTSDLMSDIISPLLPSRSNLSRFMIPRLMKIASGEIKERDNTCHYVPEQLMKIASDTQEVSPISIPVTISEIINKAYQEYREERVASEKIYDDIVKNAFYYEDIFSLEKTAGLGNWARGKKRELKTTALVVPATITYSGIQRSRMDNGEQISSLNRFIADNPGNAAMIASFLATKGVKITPKAIRAIKRGITKKASEENGYDMFKDKHIDDVMYKHYNEKELPLIKVATIAMQMGDEDYADKILSKEGLSYRDVDEYLKTASYCFKMKLEKNASELFSAISGFNRGEAIFKFGSENISLPIAVFDSLVLNEVKKVMK